MERYFVCPRGHRKISRKSLVLGFMGRTGKCSECAATGYWISIPSDYSVQEEIGSGGMGIVVRARHRPTKREAALKLLKPAFYGNPDQLDRFFLEARAMEEVDHPAIVKIYEVGQEDGVPFLSSELVEGGSLAERMRGRAWEPVDAADLMAKLARGIQSVHEQGIIHRDLKPANILMHDETTPKITDFGLAKFIQEDGGLTCTGLIMGTPSYMSPEQARGESELLGPSADIYALGVVLYQLLTGTVPFRGRSSIDILQKVINLAPELPSLRRVDLPPQLDHICHRCLAKAPHLRHESAKELAEELEAFCACPEPDTLEIPAGAAAKPATEPPSTPAIVDTEPYPPEEEPTIERPKQIIARPSEDPTAARLPVREGAPEDIGFLRGLTLEQMDALLSSGSYLEFVSGQMIFKEGDKAESLYLVDRKSVV